ncbi:unnamed protein product [Lathyrus oleraceus]|uniref:uncharacterized protein LOC127074834 n=1 Tax=Pisum sativum TaxID=3888 RepID=UPI0021D31E8C|nr:uncharacterized protein LOC127074834 [Pisum sativum]XP_050872181.1 uncharacterized protein LOC127074834 [Pisum sativum]
MKEMNGELSPIGEELRKIEGDGKKWNPILVEGSSRAWLKVELIGCESKAVLNCGVRVLEVGYGLELGACTAAFWCCCSLACVLLEARALAAFCNSELLWLAAFGSVGCTL